MHKICVVVAALGAAIVVGASPARAQEAAPTSPEGIVGPADTAQRPVAIEYSDAYETRAKIHRVASFATLPLVGTELWLGQSLYNDPAGLTSSKKGAHIAVGTGLMGLFAVNTVTGAWNMWESRNDPKGRTKRIVHGLLMMASDAGFVATSASGPGNGRNSLINFDANKSTHRTIAFTSMGLATAGYLVMLFGNH